jgi:NitT/TauT family transport system substrate-binding protein
MHRRRFLTTGAALGLSATMSRPARAHELTATWATATPGFSVVLMDYIRSRKLDEKHGLRMPEPRLYTSITSLVNDFVAGSFELLTGSWDGTLAQYNAGVPVQHLGSFTTAAMIGVVVKGDALSSVSNLRGKTVAAPIQFGPYRMTRALIRELHGFDLEKEATVQNSDSPATSVTLVMAGRADAAFAWEPMISGGMLQERDLKLIFNLGEAYKAHTGQDLQFFNVGLRKSLMDRSPGIAQRLDAMFADCVNGIENEFDQVVEEFGKRSLYPESTLRAARSSGRLYLRYASSSDASAKNGVQEASTFLARNGIVTKPADPGFFAL